MKIKTLWYGFATVMVLSFAVLLYFGREIYREAPPIPEKIVTTSGEVVLSGQDIKDGQNIWQSIGGQEVGSIWGHGAYQAPDWTADWLHREAMYLLNYWANTEFESDFDSLNDEQKASLEIRVQKEMRTNTYDVSSKNLVISDLRAKGIKAVGDHFTGVFMDGEAQAHLREAYAIPANSVKEQARMDKMNAFFFWATWACVTNRPDKEISYTNNWPSEKLVGNGPTSALILWTGFSVIILLAGIGWMGWYYATNSGNEEHHDTPLTNPILGMKVLPSMKATLKYFWVVTLLMLIQISAGVITAHYGVEGNGFFGIPLDQWMPYSLSRTWHVQLGLFWIATSWLATGLFFAPAIAGKDPKYQTLGVNVLFVSLLVIVVGSLVGQFLGIMQKLDLIQNFWFGHQGYEYVDLGRFWQIFLFAGLFIWLGLMARALLPALRARTENKNLLIMFLIASLAIASFYGAGLMWGRQTNLAIAEYWRWWVVHLWVEGFFEVFATVIIAFLFVRMKLISAKIATATVLFSTITFLCGGILGTFHHLYFTGTPLGVLAVGASFSALEIVPLVFLGYEAYHNIALSKSVKWIEDYKWPIYCFVAVAFWNFFGAGILGFLINPPLALYYMQGLNTTAAHGHAALFGVYGFLGIGLMLFVLRDMDLSVKWKEGPIKFAFWSMNIGLLLMVLLSILPIGIAQTWASVKFGLWYARSAEFMQQDYMFVLKWMRAIGDTLFAAGMVALAFHVFGLKFGWTTEKKKLSK